MNIPENNYHNLKNNLFIQVWNINFQETSNRKHSREFLVTTGNSRKI